MAVSAGRVRRVNGPVIEVEGLETAMLDLVEVGEAKLPGEVIALKARIATVQVYSYTGGVRPGDLVVTTGQPLRAELGPGLLGGVYDGMLRRLSGAEQMLRPGAHPLTLDRETRWPFSPRRSAGDVVAAGAVLGEVPETEAITFRALVPPGLAGTDRLDRPGGRVLGRRTGCARLERGDHPRPPVAGSALATGPRTPPRRRAAAHRAASARPLLPCRAR